MGENVKVKQRKGKAEQGEVSRSTKMSERQRNKKKKKETVNQEKDRKYMTYNL